MASLVDQAEVASGEAKCVVVDNGSVKGTRELESEFPQVCFLHEPIPGSYAARNTGARCADGEYLAFVDSDCIPEPNWLASIIGVTARYPDIDIHVGEVVLFEDEEARALKDRRGFAYETATAFRQKHYAENLQFGPTANLIVREATFSDLGGFDQSLLSGGDKEFGQRAAHSGYKLRYSPECVVRHPTRSNLLELEDKWRRIVGGEYRVAKGLWAHVKDIFRYAVLRPGNSLRLVWIDDRLDTAEKLLASETVLRVLGWQVSERLRLMKGGEARR